MTAPVKTKKRMGRPPYQPTDKSRAEVSALVSFGTRHQDICNYLKIDHKTLTKYYQRELDTGHTMANAAVARTLYQQAVQQQNVTAMIFWLKTRARWRESSDLNLVSEDGSMSPPTIIEIVAGETKGKSGEPKGKA